MIIISEFIHSNDMTILPTKLLLKLQTSKFNVKVNATILRLNIFRSNQQE